MASKMAAEKVQDLLLKQYRENMIYKGFYIQICLPKYAYYETTCCSEHIRETALLSKMTSKMDIETSKITLDLMFETD